MEYWWKRSLLTRLEARPRNTTNSPPKNRPAYLKLSFLSVLTVLRPRQFMMPPDLKTRPFVTVYMPPIYEYFPMDEYLSSPIIYVYVLLFPDNMYYIFIIYFHMNINNKNKLYYYYYSYAYTFLCNIFSYSPNMNISWKKVFLTTNGVQFAAQWADSTTQKHNIHKHFRTFTRQQFI